MESIRPTVLVIFDGFGYSQNRQYNAILHAHTPQLDNLFNEYPHTLIQASGTAVGLPAGFMGNSQVGHLTIGSGRIIKQPLVLINELIADHHFSDNHKITSHLQQLAHTQKALHIIGLLSDGGVHSHINHLYAFIDAVRTYDISAVFIHAITDGRDTPPHSAKQYIEALLHYCGSYPNIHLASICGRFYAMDRDHHWERTEKYYRLLTTHTTLHPQSWETVLDNCYNQGLDDQHIPPTQLDPAGIINNDDGIIFFNTRPDRARQLTAALLDKQFDHFRRTPIRIAFFITPVSYGIAYPTSALIESNIITHTLKEILATHNKTIFSIAETEKYAHITYFFDGMRETLFPGETRILIPSIVTDNFDKYPAMSASIITDRILQSLRTLPQDFYLINYANADMVGHSGNFDATVQAIECLDEQIAELYEQIVLRMNGTLYITSDHGKAEDLYNPFNQQPHTAHTTNPVPFLMIRKDLKNTHSPLPLHGLADIAPFIIKTMGLPVPAMMHHSWSK